MSTTDLSGVELVLPSVSPSLKAVVPVVGTVCPTCSMLVSSVVPDATVSVSAPVSAPVSVSVPVVTPVVNAVTAQMLKVLTDALQKTPMTATEAVGLYHNLSAQLAQYIVNELPTIEKKAALMELWIVNEVESVSCTSCFGK
jgi:hypothetical protein